jgi:hypothetical protein
MPEPELLSSSPSRRLPPAVRRAAPFAVVIAVIAAVVVLVRHDGRSPVRPHAVPSPVPVAATGRDAPAAPIAADLARVVVDPARHRLRLTFTVFNRATTQVVLLRVGRSSSGLVLQGRHVERFTSGGRWLPARLPLVLHAGGLGHLRLAYRVRRCPAPSGARLVVPALLTTREHGRVRVDLTALVPPHDWPGALVHLLCPQSSR